MKELEIGEIESWGVGVMGKGRWIIMSNPAGTARRTDLFRGGSAGHKARRPVAAKFVRAITEAIHPIQADKEGTKAIIGKCTKLTDPEGLERTYRNCMSVLMDIPDPEPAGSNTLIDDMAAKNPKAATAAPKTFVDPSFVHEMETSGFINRLTKRWQCWIAAVPVNAALPR